MRPVICLITPPVRLPFDSAQGTPSVSRGVKPDSTYAASSFSWTADELVERVAAAAKAGVHLVQIRQPGADGRPLLELTAAAVAAVRGTGARVVVNDRLDVALAAGAHGVHLRGDSAPTWRVRAAVPRGFLIGRSVHAVDEARDAAGGGAVDYVIFGTVFATDSKPAGPVAGVDRLAAVCAAVPVPVLAVGGVTIERLGAMAAAGADGFAAIGLFARGAPGRLDEVVGQAVGAFDTPRPLP
jgi:thiamine-phosphate pyrophosphorylase